MRWCSAGLGLLVSTVALGAERAGELKLDGEPWECELQEAEPTPDDTLTLRLALGELPAGHIELRLLVGAPPRESEFEWTFDDDTLSVELARFEGQGSLEITHRVGEGDDAVERTALCDLSAVFAKSEQAAPSGGNGDDDGKNDDTPPPLADANLDAAAHSWLMGGEGTAALEQLAERVGPRRPRGKMRPSPAVSRAPTLLVHGPTGRMILGQTSLREGRRFLPVMVVPHGLDLRAGMEMEDCRAPEAFRVDTGPQKAGQQGAADGWSLLPLSGVSRCGADEATYTVRTENKGGTYDGKSATAWDPTDHEHTVRMRKVHHVAAVAALGFDTAKRSRFETSNEDQPTILEVEDTVGPSAYVGATWLWGGADYEDFRWWNVATPFAAVSLTAPLDSGVAGLAITPSGGVSLAVGVSAHREDRLAKGYAAADSFSGDGDIPTTKTGISTGLFVGFTVHSDVYDALTKRFKGGDD